MKRSRKATALGFDAERDRAPRILASGSGSLADEIVALARVHGKPVIADPELSEMVAGLPAGQEIPENLYHVMAALFGMVYRLRNEGVR
ncbi:MAG: EscU/YscU/HrcU family type III secretion system export apparatus switch protein [Leptospiraceae bacterium]|nr:EscU/YscU/HrcU family type III secretion system export apparatus switch protein [Leptospiraceae bacterium]